jgi:DNA-binding beta-propeller fold protein YncE
MVLVVSDVTNTVVATIPVGADPNGIAYDSAKGEMFVTNAGTNPGDISAANFNTGNVSVISDATNSVVATVTVGPFPVSAGIAYDSAKNEVFVTYQGKTATSSSPANTGGVSVISDADNTVIATMNMANLGAVAYDSGKSEFFVITSPKSVSIISDSTNSVVGTKSAGSSPVAIAYDPAKSEIFVTNTDTNTVTIISDSTGNSTSTTPGSSFSSTLWILLIVAILIFALLLILFVLKNRKKNQPLPPPPPPQT